MIQLKSIRVEEFRGIRELELELNCKSFVVLGPTALARVGWLMPSTSLSPAPSAV